MAHQWSFVTQALQQIQGVEKEFSSQSRDIQEQKRMYEVVLGVAKGLSCRLSSPTETQEIGRIAARILLHVAKLSVPEKEGILHFVFPLLFSQRDSDSQVFKETCAVIDQQSEEQVKPLRDWFNQICFEAKEKLSREKDYQYHVAFKVNLAAQILRFMREDDVRTQFIRNLFHQARPIYHWTGLRMLLQNLPNIPDMESWREKVTKCESMTRKLMGFSPIQNGTQINDFIALLTEVRTSSEGFHQMQKMQVSQIVTSIVRKSSCKEDLFSLVQEVFPQLEEIYRSHWAIWHVKQGNLAEGIRKFFFVQDSDHQEEFCHALLEFASSRERSQEEIERALSTVYAIAGRMQNEALQKRACMAYLDHGMFSQAFAKWKGDLDHFFLTCAQKYQDTIDLEKRKQFAAALYNEIFAQGRGQLISPSVHIRLIESFGLSLERRIEYLGELIQQYPQDQRYSDILLALDIFQMQKNCLDTLSKEAQDALQQLLQMEGDPKSPTKEEKICAICCTFCAVLGQEEKLDLEKEIVAAWIMSACEHLSLKNEMKDYFLQEAASHKKGLVVALLQQKGIRKGPRSTPLSTGMEMFPQDVQQVLGKLREGKKESSNPDKDALACEACFQLFALLADEKQPDKVKTQARAWLAWAHRRLSEAHEMKMVIQEQMKELDRVGLAGIDEVPRDQQLYLQCGELLRGFAESKTPERKQLVIDQIRELEKQISAPELKEALLLKLMDLQVAQLNGDAASPQPDQATMIDACFQAMDQLGSNASSPEEKQRARETISRWIGKIKDSDIAGTIRSAYNALVDLSNRGHSPPPAPRDLPLEGGKLAPPIQEPGVIHFEDWLRERRLHNQQQPANNGQVLHNDGHVLPPVVPLEVPEWMQ